MKVTSTETEHKIYRTVRIDDGPIVQPDGYRRRFRAQTVTITYTWTGQHWEAKDRFNFSLSGPWVKKDDTNAADRATGMRPDYEDWSVRTFTDQFKFLHVIRDLLRPHGTAAMMDLRDTKVGE